jgi:hypothetical protein
MAGMDASRLGRWASVCRVARRAVLALLGCRLPWPARIWIINERVDHHKASDTLRPCAVHSSWLGKVI